MLRAVTAATACSRLHARALPTLASSSSRAPLCLHLASDHVAVAEGGGAFCDGTASAPASLHRRYNSFKARRGAKQQAQSSESARAQEKYRKARQDAMKKTGKNDGSGGGGARSLGMVVEDYIPMEPEMQPSVFTADGWRARYERVKKLAQSTFSIVTVLRAKLPGFAPVPFAGEMQTLYETINRAVPDRDLQTIRDHTTADMMALLKLQVDKVVKDGGRVKWDLVDTVERPRIVHARALAMGHKDDQWAQVIVRMRTSQIICIYDRTGKVVFGDPTIPRTLTEYPCFERHVTAKGSKWRLCAKCYAEDPKRKFGLLPMDPVVQAAMEGKSVEEQNVIAAKRNAEDAKKAQAALGQQ